MEHMLTDLKRLVRTQLRHYVLSLLEAKLQFATSQTQHARERMLW